MRTQVRRQAGDLSGLGILHSQGNAWAILNGQGNLQVGQELGQGIELLAELPIGLDPDVQDVVFQLDTFDNELKAWAWLPGQQPTSEEPMVSASIASFTSQQPVMWARDFSNVSGGDASSTFRWFELSTDHMPVVIPEPATWVIGLLCLAGSAVLCRRGRFVGRN